MIKPFRGGIGMIASRLDVPVVPVRLDGMDRVLHTTWMLVATREGTRRVWRADAVEAATITRRWPVKWRRQCESLAPNNRIR